MSSDEKERFEVTDHDLDTEFNPNRFRKKMSKNQMIYGVWADDSDEEVEQQSSRGGRGQRSSFKSGGGGGYTSGQAFVSAGVLQPSKDKETTDKEKKDGEEMETDDIPVTDSSSEEEVQFVSSSSSKPNKNNQFNSMGMQIAGLRKQSYGAGAKGFEMYGIGAKLLAGMGFQAGKGLGKDLQGISTPIEAQLRKGRGAIGLYGKEHKTAPAELLDRQKPKEPVTPKEVKWQKVNKHKEKVEYKYLTAEEVLEQKQMRVRPDAGHLAKVKVIDLTGPEQRILSGYHAISAGQQKPLDEWAEEASRREEIERGKIQVGRQSTFDIPELIHNVELLKDSCEHDIFKNDRKAKYAGDRKTAVTEEVQHLSKTVEEEERLIQNMEMITSEMQSICDVSNLDVDNAYHLLGKLKRDHEQEWELYQLYALVPAVAIPLMKEALKSWKPLENPQMPLQLLNDWAVLLGNQTEQYEIIIWEAWMPCVRQANTIWNVQNAEPMVRLIEFWKTLLPPWLSEIVYDQILLPKLTQGVEDWDPLSDVIPIHSWIHPWLPYLGTKLEIVYPTIRSKLANALGRWHPRDVSAKQILIPWISVFSKGAVDTFLLKNIIPKLQLAMQELIINPLNQDLGPWNWVMDWLDMVPIKYIVNILETMFFPKWLQFVATWLNQIPQPYFEEVQQWYMWWRGVFQEILIREPVVKDNLQKGLEMIGAAIQCPGQPMDFSFILNRSSQPEPQPHQQAPPAGNMHATPELMADAIRMTSQVPHGFRDLVQMKCEELGLIFVPVPNRYYEGKQVYKCGNALVYISANVIFVQRDGRSWIPMSIQQLIQTATS